MNAALAVALGPVLAVAASVALGSVLLRAVGLRLYRVEERVLAFVAGAVCVSGAVWLLGAAHQARKGAFVAVTAVSVALALCRARRPAAKRLPRLPLRWGMLFAAVAVPYAVLYLANALAPEVTGGGRLGLAFREWHEHRVLAPPDGMRMLFLWAFSFGQHRAAAIMHFAFLLALPLLVLCYARRHAVPGPGVFAAVLVFTAPVAAVAGTGALDDLAVACAVFAIFYLLDVQRTPGAFVACGLIAIFALSMRHTAPAVSTFRGPRELALFGTASGGLLGPVFLLAPLALLSLRDPRGQKLLAAGVLLALLGAADARWMIPSLPFLALALGIAFMRTHGALPVLASAAALFCWPAVVGVYCDRGAWRVHGMPAAASAEAYLNERLPGYAMAVFVEQFVPEREAVFAAGDVASAYTRRRIITDPVARDALLTPLQPELQPSERLRFDFAPIGARAIRVTGGRWAAAELRVLGAAGEVPRTPAWRLRGSPVPPSPAFDNSYVTRWTGSRMEVDFGTPVTVNAVVLECPPGQPAGKVRLEVRRETGEWTAAAGAPAVSRTAVPAHLREAAVEELKARGAGYLLVPNRAEGAADFRGNSLVWGILPVAEMYDARLYRLE